MKKILGLSATLAMLSGAAFGQSYPSPHFHAMTLDSTITGGALSGTNASAASVTATNSTTARTAATRAADAVNAKDFGAVGDGNSHPISGLTTFGGANVSGWSLAQWQAAYPFVTAVNDEEDEVAILAAQNAALAAGKAVYIPAGNYQANFTGAITPAVGQTVSVFGDGAATQIAVSGAVVPLNYTIPANTGGLASEVRFENFSAYQATATLAGSAIAVYGPTTSSSGASPVVNFTNVQFGQNGSTSGAFSSSVILQDVNTSNFINDKFYGAVNYSLGGPNGRNGIGVTSNGNVNKLAFGPYFRNSSFHNQNIGVLIGDGTNAYVQGVKISGGSLVGSNQLVEWHAAAASPQNDYLSVTDVDVASYGVAIDVDSVQTLVLTGNYFLGGFSAGSFLQVAETANMAQQFTIANNMLSGFGHSLLGMNIVGTTAQEAVTISGNMFFDFNATGSVPLELSSTSRNFSISGNTFADSNLPTDAGTNTWVNTIKSSTGSTAALYASGMPVASAQGVASAAAYPGVTISRSPVADQAKNVFVATAGGTQTVANNVSYQVYAPAGAIATFTTVLPPTPADGQEITFATSQTITSWTVSGNAGQSVAGAPTQLRSNEMVTLRYNSSFSTWQPKGSANVLLPQTTVSGLPSCAANSRGLMYAVSDATAPTYNGTLTGGGAVNVPVYCNGTSWTSH